MKNKRNLLYLIRDNKKKVSVIAMLAICLCTYCIAGDKVSEQTGTDDIPLHDGDVLVTSDDVSEVENPDAYLQEMRATLDMDRNKIISMLSDTENSDASAEKKKEASEEKMKLIEYMEQEKTIETLIKNKGLPECFVVITDSGVNVTVNTEELDQPTVTKICEIIMRQTDRKASEIVVQDAS